MSRRGLLPGLGPREALLHDGAADGDRRGPGRHRGAGAVRAEARASEGAETRLRDRVGRRLRPEGAHPLSVGAAKHGGGVSREGTPPQGAGPLTFLLVNFGWVLFFTKDLNEFFLYFTSLFRIKFGFLYDNTHWFLLKENIVLFSVGIFLTGPYFKSYLSKLKKSYGEKGKIYLYIFYFIILILSVIEIVSTGFLPFLYFKF